MQATSTPLLAAGSAWTAAAPYPTGIHHYGFVQNGEDFYIISGTDDSGTRVTAVRRYNVMSNTWTSLADIPLGSYAPPSVYYNGKIYVLDGVSYYLPQVLRIYDIATDTWSTGPSRPHPPGYSNGDVAGVFDGNIYVAGSTLSRYNIATNTWSDVSNSFYGGGMYAQIGQYLYVIGGFLGGGITGLYNSAESRRFDMASNTWSYGPEWSFRRFDFALVAVGNRLIALGGDVNAGYDNDYSSEVAELDTTNWPNGEWVRSPVNLPSERRGNRAGFFSTSRAGGEIWTTGGVGFDGPLNEHLFIPVVVTRAGSAIIAAGPNGALDPGETVTVRLGVQKGVSTGLCTTNALTGTLQEGNGVTSPSAPQNYGVICSGGSAFRNFSFTVDPALPCGSDVTASLVMTDGAVNYGTITYVFTTGNLAKTFSGNFDEVIAPALPPGWVASNASGNSLWATSDARSDSPPNAAFVNDGPEDGDKRLDTPSIAITSAYTKVSFRNCYDLSPNSTSNWYPALYFSGSVLELSSPSINYGTFTDITDSAVGGCFVTGGYNGIVGTSTALFGRRVWGHNSDGYITTIANLGPNVVGQTIKLRFRVGIRGSGGWAGGGWRLDNLFVGTPVCGGSAPTVTSAVSHKAHGKAGTFDIDLPLLPLDGNIGIETRAGAAIGQHQIVVTFAKPVTMNVASVTTGAGSVASWSVTGTTVIINLSGVTDAQRLGVTLSSVNDGVNLGSIMIPMGVLSCDASANGAVNSTDLVLVKSQSGQPVTASNFREDVDGDGIINAKDIAAVKVKSGRGLPK